VRFTPALHGEPLTEPASLCFVCRDGRLLVHRRDGRAAFPRLADLVTLGMEPDDPFLIGTLGRAPCFVLAQPVPDDLPDGWGAVGLRELVDLLDDEAFAAAGRALQYGEWDRNHRFCGRCGEPTARDPASWSRICASCRFAAFPRISPAVIVLVHRGDALLLAHAAHHPEGMYSVLAGFLEPGETLEECVAREGGRSRIR
jgi:NAD+ diphosphatase